MLAAWFQRLARRGLIQVSEPRVVAGLLLSMAIAEPLRAMALGLTPPLPESSIGERIQACLALFAGDARSSRCAPRDAVRAPFSCRKAGVAIWQSARMAIP